MRVTFDWSKFIHTAFLMAAVMVGMWMAIAGKFDKGWIYTLIMIVHGLVRFAPMTAGIAALSAVGFVKGGDHGDSGNRDPDLRPDSTGARN